MENLLKNPGFEDPLTDKEGKVILSTTVKGFRTVGPSSAANWLVWNNLQTQPNESFEPTTTTELVDSDSTLAGGDKKMIHVNTDGERCGIEQVFLPLNTGPALTFSSALVYVKSGKVGLGTGNGGNTGLDTFSTKTNAWELLQFPNRNAHSNAIIVFSASKGAEFYVDNATVKVLDLTGKWQCNDGGTYYLRQLDNQLWWYGEKSATNPNWSNVLKGTIEGYNISGQWADVPKGTVQQNGDMVIQVVDANHFKAVKKTGGFAGSEWTRL
ncbi:MAG TPA: hypothetical protein V6C85_24825 [Allocoleopsis sp.]